MGLKTGVEYVEDLKRIKPNIYCLGEKVEDITNHRVIRPILNQAIRTYEINHDPKYSDLATTTSPFTGDKISRFNHILLSKDDLFNRIEFNRLWANTVGSCTLRCQGCGAMNGLYSVTYDIDQKYGTEYHQRFKEWLRTVHENDFLVTGVVMDVKGDRNLRPSQQADPDLYLRVVEEREDGVVVRGAKAHQTASFLTHEMLVVPCRMMTKEDKDYVIAFAIPNGTKGVTYILQHSLLDSRALIAEDIDYGSPKYGSAFGGTALMIFDDVFIPKERIFMHGEYEYTRTLIGTFGSLARMWEGGCRPGTLDLMIGAGRAIAEYNGLAETPHIMDKLSHIAYMAETSFCCSVAAAEYAKPTPSGVYFPDQMRCSVAKQQSIDAMYEACKLINDIAGALIMTMPSEKDYKHPQLHKYMEKYLKGVPEVPTEHRIRMFRLIETISTGPNACALHFGGGTIEAQKVTFRTELDFQQKKQAAEILAGIVKED